LVDDDVLGPADHADTTPPVVVDQVAGIEPAVRVEFGGVDVVLLVVAEALGRTADPQRTRPLVQAIHRVDADLHPPGGPSITARRPVFGIARPGTRDRPVLGHAP